MSESALLENYLIVGGLLFGIGLVGFLARRNMIIMFLAAEMMLQGISLSLVAWSRFHGDWGGQMLVVFVIAVAACEAAIALALVLRLFGVAGKLDVTVWQNAREDGVPAFVDRELPEEADAAPADWPKLTPAGREPAPKEDEVPERSHV